MRFIICWILMLAIFGSSNIAPAPKAASKCDNVRGTVEAEIIGSNADCAVVIVGDVFDVAGTHIGTTMACVISADEKGNTLHAELTHDYSIGNLNFSTVDEGVLTPIAPGLFRFENRLTIVDGASGFLRAHGTVNFANGEINLAFSGQVCAE
ncbi:MAG TPA: hypothetical protein VFT44_20935 [Pyrinomonadaceae bacterium]|nr:hypothetical protein [Pyrinomonadaceae bacterium]